jgi:hypothetical protein
VAAFARAAVWIGGDAWQTSFRQTCSRDASPNIENYGPAPAYFGPHENLRDEANRKLVQSGIEGGVRLQDLVPGWILRMHTEKHM